MSFKSLEFLLFLPVVVALFYTLPVRWRMALLVLASYGFFMYAVPWYGGLLLLSTLVDFLASRKMGRLTTKKQRLPYLLLALITNLGILAAFKYAGFLSGLLFRPLETIQYSSFDPLMDIAIPLGISFYTFQTIAYSIDVFRGKQKAEPDFFRFALFVAFFPQLIAGPIERYATMQPQYAGLNAVRWDMGRLREAWYLLIWGYFKKVAVADRCAEIVDVIWRSPDTVPWWLLVAGAVLFTIQVYADFSGYTDIGRGAALLVGVRLSANWHRPLHAPSLNSMWQRWHTTLMAWFRDYLYIPLGGNRRGAGRTVANILVVFFISGLWHGAAPTFVVWGMATGLWVVLERGWMKGVPIRLPTLVAPVYTVLVFSLLMVFFRSASLYEAGTIFSRIGAFSSGTWPSSIQGFSAAVTLFAVAILLFHDTWKEHINRPRMPFVRLAYYTALLLLMLLIGNFGYHEFIYFQF